MPILFKAITATLIFAILYLLEQLERKKELLKIREKNGAFWKEKYFELSKLLSRRK